MGGPLGGLGLAGCRGCGHHDLGGRLPAWGGPHHQGAGPGPQNGPQVHMPVAVMKVKKKWKNCADKPL